MAQTTTYDTVGKKEDISDIISNISPTKYPFTSMTGADKCDNTVFQWQEDSLRAAAANSNYQGFTAAPTARTATTLRNNVTQIMQDTFQVASTTDAVSHYGRAKEFAYQAAKAAQALKSDLEYAYVGSDQSKVTPSDNTTKAIFAGFQRQIDSTHQHVTGGTSTKVTEANLLTALQLCYTDGADPNIVMVTPVNSLTIADFAKASGRYRVANNGEGKTNAIINVVDLYVSPFGEQKVVLNRFLKGASDGTANDTLVFEPAQWVKVTLRPWTRETLAKTGDNTAMMIVGEFSLKHKNQKASSVIREAASY